jgi:DNA repair protein RadA/Sms
MAKQPATIYVCQNCGNQARKWQGKCDDCGEWNTFVEEKFRPTAQTVGKGAAAVSARQFRETKPISYNDIELQAELRNLTAFSVAELSPAHSF